MIMWFLTSTLGRLSIAAGVSVLVVLGAYTKGRIDGRASYKAKMEREIANAVKKGDAARERALRDFDALPDDGLPNDGFRRD